MSTAVQVCFADKLTIGQEGTDRVRLRAVGEVVAVFEDQGADLIMLVSHGVGGTERQERVRVGNVVESLLQQAPCPIFLVSALPVSDEA